MPVIEVYLQTFMREYLLNNDVRCSILIDIESRNSQAAFGRQECDGFVLVRRHVKLDPEGSLSVQQSSLEEDGPIWFLIVIEVGSNNLRAEIRY